MTLYGAYSQGQADSPLAPLRLQYADYAVWQRGQLSGPVLEGQRRYWRERLAGAPAAAEAPDGSGSGGPSSRIGGKWLELLDSGR